ncbi:MotE family protein [Paenibacillus barengoltzii]|jgi:flagellar motility protein MotE (MotC chaperone)|uniref:MotE family protein n=1 Tax=Paenibacillus barengoltzii TaxID=343517 RepID=UPI003F8B59DD
MAKTVVDEELDEETGGGFSRFLFFMTPILFTVVLLGVLLTLFNIDFRNTMIDWGNRIPLVKNLVPDPIAPEGEATDAAKEEQKQRESTEATVKELKEQLAKQQAELQTANQQAAEQQEKVKELQEQLASVQQKENDQQQAAELEAYQKEVKKLANLYAEMSPSKAAAIFNKLTTEESLQMLSVMNNESKVAILEKMDPQKAADLSIKLKDVKTSEDLAIAALQSRLKMESTADTAATASGAGLSDTELGQTFSSMAATDAAKLVLQTYKLSPEKGLKILKSVNGTARSKILTEMAKSDEKTSVKILNQLVSK